MKYRSVYFRINTPSYYNNKYGVGFEDQEAGERFQTIATELFLNDGWEIKQDKYKSSGHCSRIIKDKQELYLHPQSFSGVVIENNIPYIEQLISNSDLFKFEKTDVYEEVFDITDEEYIGILKSKQTEIEQAILTIYTTKRSNLYITDTWTPLYRVLDKYRIKRLTHYIGVISSDNIDVQWIEEVFKNLVAEGKIVTAQCKNVTGYRSDKKALTACVCMA